jgi:hypothetical protein
MPVQTFGKLQRGNPSSFEFGAYDVSGGLNVNDVPEMIGDTDLTIAFNGYISASGGFTMRNGMSSYATSLGASPVKGLARFFQQVINGAPQSPLVKYTLAQSNGNLYNASTATNYGSIGGASANPMTWVRAQNPNDPYFTSGPTDVIVICTGIGGPYIFDGTNLYTPAGWSSATGALWCTIVNGIVWFGGIPANPRSIFGTGDGIINSFETLPGFNTFEMSQPVAGLSVLGSGETASLVIGQNTGLSLLYGTGPDNYVLQDIPSPDGVVCGRAMTYLNGVFYWLGRQGVYAFDGTDAPTCLSNKLQPWFLDSITVPGYPLSPDRSQSWMRIYNNRLHVGYKSANGATAPDTLAVYDLTTNGWTILQSTPGLYCGELLDAPNDPAPAQMIVGSSIDGNVYNWDAQVTTAVPTDNGAPITCAMQTKFFKLGVPGTNKFLTRLYPEFFITGDFNAEFIVQTDYGAASFSNIINGMAAAGSLGIWDVSYWDQAYWNLGNIYNSYGPPASRIDYDNLAGDSFSFGITTTGNSCLWTYGGLTGVFSQKGRT